MLKIKEAIIIIVIIQYKALTLVAVNSGKQ